MITKKRENSKKRLEINSFEICQNWSVFQRFQRESNITNMRMATIKAASGTRLAFLLEQQYK